jgi:hypothetical protein
MAPVKALFQRHFDAVPGPGRKSGALCFDTFMSMSEPKRATEVVVEQIVSRPGETFDIEVKRFYLPIVIKAKCPDCGREMKRDLSNDYLSYPTIGRPERLTFCHDTEEMDPRGWHKDHEFFVDVLLSVDLKIVP